MRISADSLTNTRITHLNTHTYTYTYTCTYTDSVFVSTHKCRDVRTNTHNVIDEVQDLVKK